MTGSDLLTLAPLLALTAAPVVVMLAAAFWRSHALALALTLGGLAVTAGGLWLSAGQAARQVTPLLRLDDYALLLIGLLAVATAAVAVFSRGYLRGRGVHPEEYYVLLLTATLGAATLVASTHFASFFLGLEILSVSLYALIVYPLDRAVLVEAAVKYLVLAGATSAFLLFGMALVYADAGTMTAAGLAPLLAAGGDPLLALGVVLMLVGVGFKLAVVPFHMWTPDVYQGAPAPVTAYVATVSKGAVLALLLRLFLPVTQDPGSALFLAVAAVAVASMVVGNLLALRQDNVKRLLAYSSIAHLGYLLVAFLAGGDSAATAATFYLVAYFATTLVAFGVVGTLSTPGHEAETLGDFAGLARRRRWTAAAFTVALFSLAGIPLTAGFMGKLYLVAAGAGAALWVLVVVLVLTSAVGLYYYVRLVAALFARRPEGETGAAIDGASGAVLAALTAFVLVVGVYPTPFIELVERAVATLP